MLRGLLQDLPLLGAVAVVVLCVLLFWRLWMFTIRPLIWPSDPKELPYWIPCTSVRWDELVDFLRLTNSQSSVLLMLPIKSWPVN
jgi:hypothetical protein